MAVLQHQHTISRAQERCCAALSMMPAPALLDRANKAVAYCCIARSVCRKECFGPHDSQPDASFGVPESPVAPTTSAFLQRIFDNGRDQSCFQRHHFSLDVGHASPLSDSITNPKTKTLGMSRTGAGALHQCGLHHLSGPCRCSIRRPPWGHDGPEPDESSVGRCSAKSALEAASCCSSWPVDVLSDTRPKARTR